MSIKIKYLYIFKTALLANMLWCLAAAANATEKKINLLPEGAEDKAILVPESVVRMSNTLNNMLEDLATVTDNMNLPVENLNRRTLSAITNILTAMHKLQEKNKQYRFNSMKWLVKNSFPYEFPATASDSLDFLLAANFLDIPGLLTPAAAVAVDSVLDKEEAKEATGKIKFFAQLVWELANAIESKEDIANLYQSKFKPLLKKQKIPEELFSYFKDYLKWKKDPTSFITPVGQPISVGRHPEALLVADRKLYVANKVSNNISVIDLETNQVVETLTVGTGPKALMVFANRLYVANSLSNNISVINLETGEPALDPIVVGNGPRALSVYGNKLYVANSSSNTISVIDLDTHQIIGDPIAVGKLPSALGVFDNKLYVANTLSSNISVIDLTNNQVVGSIATGWLPLALSVYRDNLYVANSFSGTISVIDLKTDQAKEETIAVGWLPAALSAYDDYLFVANSFSNSISVIKLTTSQVIGTLVVGRGPWGLSIADKKLYVANELGDTISVFDLYKFLYYSN